MRKDVLWWLKFLPLYNGVSVAWMEQRLEPVEVVSVDASGTGVGGYLTGREYYVYRTPWEWKDVNIAYMEMWAVIIALKVWGAEWLRRKKLVIYCDN